MPSRIDYEYPRIKTSVANQEILKEQGYTPVFSSNVSAIQRDGTDLYIRFHNGTVYQYPRRGRQFNSLLVSPSKGKWVWRNLRATNASFNKVGNFPLTGDLDLTTEEMETRLAQIGKLTIAKEMVSALSVTSIKDVAIKTIANKGLLSTLVSKDSLYATIIPTLIG